MVYTLENAGFEVAKVTALDDGADDYGEDTQALRSVMASTRRKIEKNPAKPEYILTEIGIGYRMRERDK